VNCGCSPLLHHPICDEGKLSLAVIPNPILILSDDENVNDSGDDSDDDNGDYNGDDDDDADDSDYNGDDDDNVQW